MRPETGSVDSPVAATMVAALNNALAIALEADPDVVIMGPDVGGYGGLFRVTAGLQQRFGKRRVLDTALDEPAFVSSAIGMALYGLRPVVEIPFADRAFAAFDQLAVELATIGWRTSGRFRAPVTIRVPYGAGVGGGPQMSRSPEAHFVHVPGLKVVCPSNPADAKGLLLSAVRCDDPVVFMEPKALYRRSAAHRGGVPVPVVPKGDVPIPLGTAKVVRRGDDVTVIAWGNMVQVAQRAAQQAAVEGIECTIIDPRTLWPLDTEALVAAVGRTGRAVVVHEAPRTCGFGAEIVATLQQRCFLNLEAPIVRVAGLDTPVPYAGEMKYLPSAERVLGAIEGVVNY